MVVPSVVSLTETPIISPSVNMLFTSGLPHSRLGRELMVDVQRLGIVREAGEQRVVHLRHGAAQRMLELAPDLELLQIQPLHDSSTRLPRQLYPLGWAHVSSRLAEFTCRLQADQLPTTSTCAEPNTRPSMRFSMKWYDLAGSAGVVLIVAAFLLLQLERAASNGLLYLIANAIGAALILLSLSFDFNLSAFLMEAFWLAISLLGLARRLVGTRDGPREPKPSSPVRAQGRVQNRRSVPTKSLFFPYAAARNQLFRVYTAAPSPLSNSYASWRTLRASIYRQGDRVMSRHLIAGVGRAIRRLIPSRTEIGLQNVQTQRGASVLWARSVGSQPLAVADVLAAGLFRGLSLLVAGLTRLASIAELLRQDALVQAVAGVEHHEEVDAGSPARPPRASPSASRRGRRPR